MRIRMRERILTNYMRVEYTPGQTMADYVAEKLRMDIIQKRIPADSIITVKEIAERYNVSLMPVRDAFHTLKGERFLDVVPYKHVRILRIDKEYIRNVYDFTRVVECLLLEDLVKKGTEETFKEAERINNQIRRLIKEVNIDPQEFLYLNTQFHNVIYELSSNDVAKEQVRYYDRIVRALRVEYQVKRKRLEATVKEHQEVIDAARERSLEKAQKCLTRHIMDARDDFLKNDL